MLLIDQMCCKNAFSPVNALSYRLTFLLAMLQTTVLTHSKLTKHNCNSLILFKKNITEVQIMIRNWLLLQ
jgi:hypothetical protein